MRPRKDDYYLDIAKSVCGRATCSRRRFGAIVVKRDAIISTGYNGAARKVKDCLEWGACLKDEVGAPSGSGYDYCLAVHAEENTIINAARNGASVLGGTMYIYGENYEDGSIAEAKPCDRCRRAIINAGIECVVTRRPDGSMGRYVVSEWVREDTIKYGERLKSESHRR
ncbi:MAG: cytidine/deoxycytidylate deaminase family protein [Candidatus Geothermarchaeales archaeon]